MRHLTLISHIDSRPQTKIVLDARSITQLLYMHSVIGGKFSEKNTILLWKGKESSLLLASKLIDIPRNYHILDIDSKDKALMLNFNTVRQIKDICKSIDPSFNNVQLFTSYASGMYFELLRSTLSVKNEDIIQFDDGLANKLIEINKYRMFRFIIYLMHGFFCFPPRHRLFSDIRFKRIYTSINPKNIISIEGKQIVDISKKVSKNFHQISSECINIDSSKSAILMTTHSVESGRMVQSEYHQLITDVYSKLQELGVKDVYLSKHPTEKSSNDDFYNKIGLNATYRDYPAELIVANRNIAYIANPINSTIMMSAYLKHLNKIEAVVSYIPKKSPYEGERVEMINKTLSKYSIKNYVL
jgi:hypothetical protein